MRESNAERRGPGAPGPRGMRERPCRAFPPATPERRQLGKRRGADSNPRHVRDELHEKAVLHHAAVGAQLDERISGLDGHRVQDVADLVRDRLERSPCQMRARAVLAEAHDRPRAFSFQYGAPRPRRPARDRHRRCRKAPREALRFLGCAQELQLVLKPGHCRPGTVDDPLKGVRGLPLCTQATVVTMPPLDRSGLWPTLRSTRSRSRASPWRCRARRPAARRAPPASRHHAADRNGRRKRALSVRRAEPGRARANLRRAEVGHPNSSQSPSSQRSRAMSKSSVRLAFVWSVAKTRPEVRRWTR